MNDPIGRILDVPALSGIGTGKSAYMEARWRLASMIETVLIAPWCAVAVASAELSRQERARLQVYLSMPRVEVSHCDLRAAFYMADAVKAGAEWDTAHVVRESIDRGCWPVITDDAHVDRLLALDPNIGYERMS